MKKYILLIMALFGLLVLSGCGGSSDNISNSSPTAPNSSNALEMQAEKMRITGNLFTAKVSIVKKVDSSYKIELSNFNISVEGCTLQQEPTFTPNVLNLDGTTNSFASVNIAGAFSQSCDSEVYTFSATQKTTKDGEVDTRILNTTYIDNGMSNGYAFNNLTSILNITSYDKYKIEFQLTQDGIAIPNAPVAMKVFDNSLGSVESNFAITDENGNGNFSYIPPTVFPEAGTLAIVYTDGNITLEEPIALKFNLDTDVSDGRATTLSIVYESTEYDEKRGMIGHYHVHVVDRNSNLPLIGVPIKFSLVNGVKEINGQKLQKSKGAIYNTDPVTFIDNSINFETQTKVEINDNLIVFPSEGRTDSSYLGGWNIKTINENLTFSKYYSNLVNKAQLTYIVGNEQRVLGGNNGNTGSIAIAHVEIVEDTTDADGYAYFDIVFDPKLAGHTVAVEAHGDENGNRIGVSQKIALRWDDIKSVPEEGVTIVNTGGVEIVPMSIVIATGNGATESLIGIDLTPSSFTVETAPNCTLNKEESNFNTGDYGRVLIAVNTDGNTSATDGNTSSGGVDECTVTWAGGMSSLYYEY